MADLPISGRPALPTERHSRLILAEGTAAYQMLNVAAVQQLEGMLYFLKIEIGSKNIQKSRTQNGALWYSTTDG